ncbi:MAG: cation-translocating P-type ATPase [Candidatus Eiseniibacteriota bacterium]
MTDWHTLTIDETLAELDVDPVRGLDPDAVGDRRAIHGPNALVERRGRGPWSILAGQFRSVLVLVLIAAALVSGLVLEEWVDASVIGVIVVLNALVGFRQEYRAERSMEALERLAAPVVRVRRGGHLIEVESHRLVPGDIVLLEAGSMVPADCRLLETAALRVDESSLTGESVPVDKQTAALGDPGTPLGDRTCMTYMGTIVTYGRGVAVVCATGMQTELGAIADRLQTVEKEATPLQVELDRLGRLLLVAAVVLIAIVAAIGWLRGAPLQIVFLTAVSMAVAAIPEGLPAVVTIALALGAQRMLARRALVRRLPVVETLGSVTTICSDKTGTLTQNRMAVTTLLLPDDRLEVPSDASSRGARRGVAAAYDTLLVQHPDVALLLMGGALCNDAIAEVPDDAAVGRHDASGGDPTAHGNEAAAGSAVASGPDDLPHSEAPRAIGDPTEGALVIAAALAGMPKEALETHLPRVAEAPFDSERRRMTTVHAVKTAAEGLPGPLSELWRDVSPLTAAPEFVAFTKGAADSVLAASSHVWVDGRARPLDAVGRAALEDLNASLAADGVRVLGVAWRFVETPPRHDVANQLEHDLVFLGMLGMADPVRPEAVEAIRTCRAAGIRTIMITGDHPLMARSIAGQLGMLSGPLGDDDAAPDGAHRPRTDAPGQDAAAQDAADAPEVLTGADLATFSPETLRRAVRRVATYARVAPEQKLDIVDALQAEGEICAMTGDGVNDAPALRSADIGVAMGVAGTDVAREAADMVLQDDNFATIVEAVEEGRTIFANIRRFVRFLLSCNTGELWIFLIAPFLGMPLPLMPVQILWMNLVTDGLPALGLGVEPPEPDIMRRPPRPPRAPIVDRGQGAHILWVGLLVAAAALALGALEWRAAGSPGGAGSETHVATAASTWQTILFTTMVFAQLALALVERSDRASLWTIGLASNRTVLLAVLASIALQLAVVYLPPAQVFFKTVPLDVSQLGLCAAAGLVAAVAVEIEKALRRRFSPPLRP